MAVQEPVNERMHERRVEVTPTEARQGRTGRPVLIVLVCALLLAMVAWAAAEFFGAAIAPANDTGGGENITAPAGDTTAPAGADVIDNNPPASDQRQTAPATIDQQPTSNQ